jgi:hypothetical protein
MLRQSTVRLRYLQNQEASSSSTAIATDMMFRVSSSIADLARDPSPLILSTDPNAFTYEQY